MQQHQRARAHLVHHVFGAKVKHALRGLGGELLQGARYQLALQARRQGHDLHARHHQGSAGFFAVGAAFGQHVGELGPGLGRGVLAPELVLSMAPATGRNHARNAGVDRAGIHRHCRAKARANEANGVGLHTRLCSHEAHRIQGGLHLFHANQVAAWAFAVATARHVKAQGDVAHGLNFGAGAQHVLCPFVAAKAVQHHQGGSALAGFEARWPTQHARQCQALRMEGDGFFVHVVLSFISARSRSIALAVAREGRILSSSTCTMPLGKCHSLKRLTRYWWGFHFSVT